MCKALESHSNEQSGNHLQFKAYLQTKGVPIIPLARFVGNRFNVSFHNATGMYYIREHIQEFYRKAFGTPNRLHVAVFADICTGGFIAACRALGMIGKLVTGPLWRELECPDTSIAKMSGTYQALCASFERLEADPSSLLDGSAKLFPGVQINVDAVHHELFTSNGIDGATLVILKLIIAAFARYSKKNY